MKVLEFEAKMLLMGQGLPIPKGEVITSPEDAARVAQTVGWPVAVKAQIPIGGRMKAGGVHFAATPAEATAAAERLLGRQIRGFPVDRVLVEEQVDVATEIFLAVTYDTNLRAPMFLASKAGGIDVEATDGIVRCRFSTLSPIPDSLCREVAAELGFSGHQLLQLSGMIARLARCFVQWDALLVEVNPLVLDTTGRWWVADVHLELDDDATFRQGEIWAQLPTSVQAADRRSEFERRAIEIDSIDHRGVAGRLVPFDGDLGLLIGGGGASLTAFDAVLDAGLAPANYCEIGGNPSVWKIKELTKLILSQPQVKRLAVIMNVVSNTRVDLVARGVIKGVLELGRDPQKVIAAFRVPGSWEEEGQAILRHYGVPFFGRETSIDQVVEAIARQM